ncbi:hypothetical protein V6N12_076038 [Hibiscus sabdariffa]|uniref:Uncharacterized protein n=1 Tax=Hibiscus sabdariffa TaxID=183260 RepID=A0ABR2AYR1_9ROSI
MPWNEKVLGCTQPSEPFFEFRDADSKPSYSLRLPKLSHSCLASSLNCSHGLNCSSRAVSGKDLLARTLALSSVMLPTAGHVICVLIR